MLATTKKYSDILIPHFIQVYMLVLKENKFSNDARDWRTSPLKKQRNETKWDQIRDWKVTEFVKEQPYLRRLKIWS